MNFLIDYQQSISFSCDSYSSLIVVANSNSYRILIIRKENFLKKNMEMYKVKKRFLSSPSNFICITLSFLIYFA